MRLHQLLVLICCIVLVMLHPRCAKGSAIHEDEPANFTWASTMPEKGRSLLPSYSQSAIISRYIVVDKHGNGQYRTIQAAVDSVPESNKQWVYIQINAGLYVEKVTIPYTKPYIIFQGAGRTSTVISWSDRASSSGTADSATFSANADSFVARGMGFRNAAPPPQPGAYGGQAVAVLLSGDMMAFYECGFYGAQDTLFDYQGRHYFKGCYIEGSIDFIFGHGQSTYKGCELYVKAQPGYLSGSITAQNRDDSRDAGGFVFVECKIGGTGEVFLGRAWGAYSRVIFMYTYMSSIITPEGWSDWGNPSRRSTAFYGEYKCYGPGADTSGRASWSHKLSDAQAQPFLELNYINGGSWLQES
eukprot:c18214_g1_i2 orf=306-1379(-)